MLDRALIQKILHGSATEQELSSADPTEVLAVKRDQSEMHFRFVPGAVSVERAVAGDDDEPEVVKHVASDESRDSMGDRILVKGWELTRFEKNPQLLYAHDQRGLPIGTVSRCWKGRHKGGPALMTESIFHKADENPAAPLVGKLVVKGALPGVSVGFVPLKMVWPESEEQREKMDLGPWGVLHEKSELLELSVVPVPANANALRVKMLERAKPLLTLAREEGLDKALIEHVEHTFNLTQETEREIRRRTILVPDVKSAMAEVVDALLDEETLEDPEPKPEGGEPESEPETPAEGDDDPDGEPEPEPDSDKNAEPRVHYMRFDRESLAAIRGLTEALNKNVEDSANAASAGGDPPAGDPQGSEPDDFVAGVFAAAKERL